MRDTLREQFERKVDEAVDGPGTRTLGARSAPGDEARRRGIPILGGGTAGHIPGTHPERTVLARSVRKR